MFYKTVCNNQLHYYVYFNPVVQFAINNRLSVVHIVGSSNLIIYYASLRLHCYVSHIAQGISWKEKGGHRVDNRQKIIV